MREKTNFNNYGKALILRDDTFHTYNREIFVIYTQFSWKKNNKKVREKI